MGRNRDLGSNTNKVYVNSIKNVNGSKEVDVKVVKKTIKMKKPVRKICVGCNLTQKRLGEHIRIDEICPLSKLYQTEYGSKDIGGKCRHCFQTFSHLYQHLIQHKGECSLARDFQRIIKRNKDSKDCPFCSETFNDLNEHLLSCKIRKSRVVLNQDTIKVCSNSSKNVDESNEDNTKLNKKSSKGGKRVRKYCVGCNSTCDSLGEHVRVKKTCPLAKMYRNEYGSTDISGTCKGCNINFKPLSKHIILYRSDCLLSNDFQKIMRRDVDSKACPFCVECFDDLNQHLLSCKTRKNRLALNKGTNKVRSDSSKYVDEFIVESTDVVEKSNKRKKRVRKVCVGCDLSLNSLGEHFRVSKVCLLSKLYQTEYGSTEIGGRCRGCNINFAYLNVHFAYGTSNCLLAKDFQRIIQRDKYSKDCPFCSETFDDLNEHLLSCESRKSRVVLNQDTSKVCSNLCENIDDPKEDNTKLNKKSSYGGKRVRKYCVGCNSTPVKLGRHLRVNKKCPLAKMYQIEYGSTDIEGVCRGCALNFYPLSRHLIMYKSDCLVANDFQKIMQRDVDSKTCPFCVESFDDLNQHLLSCNNRKERILECVKTSGYIFYNLNQSNSNKDNVTSASEKTQIRIAACESVENNGSFLNMNVAKNQIVNDNQKMNKKCKNQKRYRKNETFKDDIVEPVTKKKTKNKYILPSEPIKQANTIYSKEESVDSESLTLMIYNDKKVLCPYCKERVCPNPTDSNLNQHFFSVHGKKIRRFIVVESYENRLMNPVSCLYCDKVCQDRICLAMHTEDLHRDMLELKKEKIIMKRINAEKVKVNGPSLCLVK